MTPKEINQQNYDRLQEIDQIMSQLSFLHKFFEDDAAQETPILEQIEEKNLSDKQKQAKQELEQMFKLYEVGDFMECLPLMDKLIETESNQNKAFIEPPADVASEQPV